MKVIIKAVTATKELTEDQKQIIRRVSMVLREHGFAVCASYKVKKVKTIKLKVS